MIYIFYFMMLFVILSIYLFIFEQRLIKYRYIDEHLKFDLDLSVYNIKLDGHPFNWNKRYNITIIDIHNIEFYKRFYYFSSIKKVKQFINDVDSYEKFIWFVYKNDEHINDEQILRICKKYSRKEKLKKLC